MRTSPARLAATLAYAAALAASSACSTPAPADFSAAGGPPAASPTACTSNYHAGVYSLDMIMQNDTGKTLTLVPTWTGRGDGHWAARPPTTLNPGACAVINAYSDDLTAGLWLTATYQLPDDTFVPFACAAENLDGGPASCNTNAYTKMTGMDPNHIIDGTTSVAWQVTAAASSGTEHTHWTLIARTR